MGPAVNHGWAHRLGEKLLIGLLALGCGLRAGAGRFGFRFTLGGLFLRIGLVLLCFCFVSQPLVTSHQPDDLLHQAFGAFDNAADGF